MNAKLVAVAAAWIASLGALAYVFIASGRSGPAASSSVVDQARARHDRPAPRPTLPGKPPPSPSRPAGRPEDDARAEAIRAKMVGATGASIESGSPSDHIFAPPVKQGINLELSGQMDEANRAYDKADYEGAQQLALKALEQAPGNTRMMRIVVSTACAMGEADKAQKYWSQLPAHDQDQMSTRCKRFDVTFTASP